MIFRELRKAVLVGMFLLGVALASAAILGNSIAKSSGAAESIRQTLPMP